MRTFRVIDRVSGYEIEHRPTRHRAWIGDGVSTLFTPHGHIMIPGSEYFRRSWQATLNEKEAETLEAFFPELCAQEPAQ